MNSSTRIITLPFSVPLNKAGTKKFSLNLNEYRNAHFHVLNKAKRVFEEVVSPALAGLTAYEDCRLTYVLFPPTHRRLDIANVGAVVDKFFSDTLVQAQVLPDDNSKYLKEVTFTFGEVSPSNPRIEAHISPYLNPSPSPAASPPPSIKKREPKVMKIRLTAQEAKEALQTYLQSLINLHPGTELSIDLAGLPEDFEWTASVVRIGEQPEQQEPTQKLEPKAKTKTKPESKPAKPVPVKLTAATVTPEPEPEEPEQEQEEPEEAPSATKSGKFPGFSRKPFIKPSTTKAKPVEDPRDGDGERDLEPDQEEPSDEDAPATDSPQTGSSRGPEPAATAPAPEPVSEEKVEPEPEPEENQEKEEEEAPPARSIFASQKKDPFARFKKLK